MADSGLDPVSAGLTIGGSLVSSLAGASAQRRRNNVLAGGIREQDRAGIDASNAVNSALSDIGVSTPDVAGYRGQFMAALRGMPQVQGPVTASRAFKTGATAANSTVAADGARLADVFARIKAPTEQRVAEALRLRRAGGQLQDINRAAASKDFLTQLRAQSIQPNALTQILGGVAQNAGTSGLFAPSRGATSLGDLVIAPNARTTVPGSLL